MKDIGRILLGSLFVFSALNSLFFGFSDFVNMIKSKGIEYPVLIAFGVLLFKLICGISIVYNNYRNYVVTLLIAFVFCATILYHNPTSDKGQINNMLKNIAIVGGLMLLYK